MYIPLIPTGRYKFMDSRKQIQIDSYSTKVDHDSSNKGSMEVYQCRVFEKFDWAEILYNF